MHRIVVGLLIKDDRKFASGAGKISGKFEHRDELRRTSSGKTEGVQRAFISIKLYCKDQLGVLTIWRMVLKTVQFELLKFATLSPV